MLKHALTLLILCFSGAFASFAAIPADSLDTLPVAGQEHEAAAAYRIPLYERQLDSIEKTVPLDYNEIVRSHIELYTYKREGLVSRMMGLSEYYFPIFEQALKEKGLPVELKYLSIVESALNPMAVSRVGATGLWQFMYTTAREYGLQMNSYIDERRDPVAASQAAAEYLNNMYGRYGDWLLAIASYNCGPGNVDRAIYKAGGKLDFWAIMPYLPRETRNYVPAYIAVTYAMNYAKAHDIYSAPPEFAFTPMPVQIEKYISLSSLSRSLDMDPEELYLINPKYRRRIVNGSGASPQTVWLPPAKAELYASLQKEGGAAKVIAASNDEEETAEPVYYKVRSGDNLSAIANRFRCSVQDLKVWNDLRGTRLVPGQRLLVSSEEKEIAAREETYLAKTYRVRRGDTLSSIAARFNTSVAVLKELNGIRSASSLRAGSTIRINPEG
ncbi:membrane-bound lytic murein transglycosylase D [Anseongella ginsenosidimutans]|uniref:Membrane-bound lytic murein transglycosylase D n=1 Tax=Anseongella ginsenosidimutans TaxID=496056 RepID=A0A4R3KWY8_9SPHI|nr:LysM peptidoglycan-binding domain-containing protein [Anseongella ginsenosidimutans]QEC51027.1 LysM peptidoglycan-binding domain-containing protein [Anseongella ginsenosidimutans]TCS90319.1 membrane-bound lytic murein transglycosylase D [Anseongella ginsenosidimutans]